MSEQPIGAATGPHHCSACGRMHGDDDQAAAVQIAKINADRDVQVARIERGAVQHTADVGAETDIAVAELQTAAGVEETAALAEGIADSGGSDEMPTIVDVPVPDAEPEVQDTIEPRDDETDDGAPPPAKSSGLSYWP